MPRLSRIHEIIEKTRLRHGISRAEIMGQSRAPRVSWPRQEAMAQAVKEGFSLQVVADQFGRHHTTVLHAVRAVKARNETA